MFTYRKLPSAFSHPATLGSGGVQASRTHAAKFVQSCYVGIQVGSVGFPLKPPASFLLFLSPPWFFFFFSTCIYRGGEETSLLLAGVPLILDPEGEVRNYVDTYVGR